jgi:hypothetical protein
MLTPEEFNEMQRLRNTGFTNWNKKDLQKYVSGCESFGVKDVEKITELIKTKTVAEVQAYAEVFWERKEELA